MYVRETTKWKKFLEPARRMHDSGKPIEEILRSLRLRGATKAESMRLPIELSGLTSEEAKLAVRWSDTWQDVRAADEEVHATIEDAVKQLVQSLDQRKRRRS